MFSTLIERVRAELAMLTGRPTRTDYYWQAMAYNSQRELAAQRAAALTGPRLTLAKPAHPNLLTNH